MSASAPTWLLIGIPIACFATMTLIVVCACVAAGRADEVLSDFEIQRQNLESLRHSEAQEGGRQPVTGPPGSPAAVRALGNAMGAQATDKRLRSQVLTVQQPREVPCSSVVVELDAIRIRRANRGSVA